MMSSIKSMSTHRRHYGLTSLPQKPCPLAPRVILRMGRRATSHDPYLLRRAPAGIGEEHPTSEATGLQGSELRQL